MRLSSLAIDFLKRPKGMYREFLIVPKDLKAIEINRDVRVNYNLFTDARTHKSFIIARRSSFVRYAGIRI